MALAWRVGRGLRAGWEWRGLGRSGDFPCQELKSCSRLQDETERGNQSEVGEAAAQCSLSPVNPRKLYVLWQRLSMVLLHLLGQDKNLLFPPSPESLELMTVPGVCHEEMTASALWRETRVPQLNTPPVQIRASARPVASLPGSYFHWALKDPPSLLDKSQAMGLRVWRWRQVFG